MHPANISNLSEVANSIFEIMLPGIQINYVDQNGKVVETAQISGKVGDKVITNKYAGTEVKLDGVEYIVLRQADILAKVED